MFFLLKFHSVFCFCLRPFSCLFVVNFLISYRIEEYGISRQRLTAILRAKAEQNDLTFATFSTQQARLRPANVCPPKASQREAHSSFCRDSGR